MAHKLSYRMLETCDVEQTFARVQTPFKAQDASRPIK
jgi:hypothetical protein